MDKATMREFDALCLTPVTPMAPDEIRALREREQVSQPVLASYLNVRNDAVSKWERGEKRPDGPSLKLLTSNTRAPRPPASRAIAAPLIPPPTPSRSKSFSIHFGRWKNFK